MITARDLKYAARIREHAFLHVFDPGPVDAYRHLVFGLARHGAGVTTDALAIVDYEPVFHPLKVSTPRQSIILGRCENGG